MIAHERRTRAGAGERAITYLHRERAGAGAI